MCLAVREFNTMNRTITAANTRDEQLEKFYLPAVTVPTELGHVEAFIQERFDFHGVVPIPTNHYM